MGYYKIIGGDAYRSPESWSRDGARSEECSPVFLRAPKAKWCAASRTASIREVAARVSMINIENFFGKFILAVILVGEPKRGSRNFNLLRTSNKVCPEEGQESRRCLFKEFPEGNGNCNKIEVRRAHIPQGVVSRYSSTDFLGGTAYRWRMAAGCAGQNLQLYHNQTGYLKSPISDQKRY